MILSTATIEVLKNFSGINQNLFIKEGNQINTMSIMKNIVANATIPDSFPKEFAIYDLNEFLSALSLFDVPTLDFTDNSVIIKEQGGASELRYFYSDPSIVVSPKTDLKMPAADASFLFTKEIFNKIQRSAAALGVHDLVLSATVGGDIVLTVKDKKNDTSNDFSVVVGENAESSNTFYFKTGNLKLIPGDYDVSVSNKGISHFKNTGQDVEYFIALEAEV